MSTRDNHDWALVLAAGEGSRLQALTTMASGVAVPKQFCSFGGGVSLLHDALRRAAVVAPAERTSVIVAEQHRRWWDSLQLAIPAQNVVSQPSNRGTANGILLPLLHIVHTDPHARLLVLPSDHYVRNEPVLDASLRLAMAALAAEPESIIVLGITPDDPDPEFGYLIAEGAGIDGARVVSHFVEKPELAVARALMANGGLWNSFIFCADAQVLLREFEVRFPNVVGEMRDVVSSSAAAAHEERLAQLYAQLPELDFSRDILQKSPLLLRALPVPACGWSDLGTPRRLIEAASRLHSMPGMLASGLAGSAAFLDLAASVANIFSRAG